MYYSYNYEGIQNKYTGVYIDAQRASNSLSTGSMIKSRNRKKFFPLNLLTFSCRKNDIPQDALNTEQDDHISIIRLIQNKKKIRKPVNAK